MDKRAFMWLQQPGGGGMVILVRTGSPAANFLRGPRFGLFASLSLTTSALQFAFSARVCIAKSRKAEAPRRRASRLCKKQGWERREREERLRAVRCPKTEFSRSTYSTPTGCSNIKHNLLLDRPPLRPPPAQCVLRAPGTHRKEQAGERKLRYGKPSVDKGNMERLFSPV